MKKVVHGLDWAGRLEVGVAHECQGRFSQSQCMAGVPHGGGGCEEAWAAWGGE